MGPSESPTNASQDQGTTLRKRRKRATPRPRTRRCLLKGCESRYRPQQARQRYCSPRCREAARAWSRWKAQEKYRATPTGKEKRKAQSQRYRERMRTRQEQVLEGAESAARVITTNFFSGLPATGRAATRSSCGAADRRGNGSVPRSADARWSASGSGSDTGERPGLGRKHPEALRPHKGCKVLASSPSCSGRSP
jgi:hypothetical protein